MALSEYTSVASVFSIVPRIGSFTNVTSARVSGTIQAVSARIDSKLGKLYDTPFTDTPPAIISITNDLTMARLLRSLLTSEDPARTEWLREFQGPEATATEDLDAIESGDMVLVNSGGDVIDTIETEGALMTSYNKGFKPTFDMRHPSQWQVDPDRITDEANE